MSDVFRVSIIGTGPGSETFDTSFWVSQGAPTSSGAANTLAGQIRDAWQTHAATAWKARLGPWQTYTEVRVYSYPNGGPTAPFIGAAAIATGVGTGAYRNPLQTCMVASLRTGFAGRRSRGRMYLPATGDQLSVTHDWPLATCTAVANATSAFFTAVNGINAIGDVVVLSQVGAGVATKVTSIVVDGKPDIQRRRANKFTAAYTFTATVA
jgi:hypothetical protein